VKLTHKIRKTVPPRILRPRLARFSAAASSDPVASAARAAGPEVHPRNRSALRLLSIQVSKYARVGPWLKTNIERAQDLQLHRSSPKEILDLGCGGGFFLYVCQQLGHRGLGLDLDWFPLYTELIDLFGWSGASRKFKNLGALAGSRAQV